MKICTNPNCLYEGKPQELTAFCKHRNNHQGVTSWCKACHNAANKTVRAGQSREEQNIPLLIKRAIELSKVKSNSRNKNSAKIKSLAFRIFKAGLFK